MVKSLAKYTLPYWCIRWGGHQRIDFFHGLQFLHFSGNVHNSWNLVGQYLWPPSTGLALRISNFKILKILIHAGVLVAGYLQLLALNMFWDCCPVAPMRSVNGAIFSWWKVLPFFYNILVGEVCEARGAWEASGWQRMHCEVNDGTI